MKYFTIILLIIPLFSNAQVEEGTLLGRWFDTTLVASKAHNNTYNDVWGLSVNGGEYAVIGSTRGTHIIDVSNPENPQSLFTINGGTQGTGIIHRDFHHYQCYLYAIADEGATSTLQIIDISGLPDKIEVVYDNADIVRTAHNMFIDSAASKLYFLAVTGVNGRSAMQVFDLSEDPLDPKFLGSYFRFGDIQAAHVHDAFIQNDTAFLNCGRNGFAIVDFSDMSNPKTLATMRPDEYPNAGYNHSGWLDNSSQVYYMADENHGSPLKVVDISNMDNIHVIKQFDAASTDENSIAHNMIVSCNYLYVSYYYDGLQVYDISDPTDPKRVMYYPTSLLDNDRRYRGAWGVYPLLPSGNILVADMQRGLFVIEGIDGDCDGITTCSVTTSIENPINSNNISAFYADGRISISLSDYLQDLNEIQIQLFNINGNAVDVTFIQNDRLGLSFYGELNNALPGIYIVSVRSGKAKIFDKIYVQ